MYTLELSKKEFLRLGEGKTVTIRKGRRKIGKGLLNFRCSEEDLEAFVRVTDVYICPFMHVKKEDVAADGANTHKELLNELREYYPGFQKYGTVTVIKFDFHIN